MKHKHADMIIAWANGAEIECFSTASRTWYSSDMSDWADFLEYRIKPEPKPDTVEYCCVRQGSVVFVNPTDQANIKLTFDGDSDKLKSVEMIK